MPDPAQFAARLLENMAVPTFVLDAHGCVLIWNQACERLTGVRADTLLGTRRHWQAFYDKERPCLADLVWQQRLDELETLYPHGEELQRSEHAVQLQAWCRMPQLSERLYLAIDAAWICDTTGTLVAVVETLRDLTMHKQAQMALQQLASKDGLTGLDNRRRFDAALDQEWRRAMRQSNLLSLIMLDVDCFKRYNDHYGHLQGDACLRAIAEVLQSAVTRPGDMVARFGGEEFAVILPGVHVEGATVVAERIRARVYGLLLPHARSEVEEYVTVSLGVASLLPNARNVPANLLMAADNALYAAKAYGRNRCCIDGTVLPVGSET
ncbi:MAG: diguanylate cyclase [Burkholderiaceae bacterium]|nr:MAG: diguanylate cyclase [Burkholderiaceae bacterium]